MRGKETLIHILHTVFDLADTDLLVRTMKLGRYDILTFVTMPDTIIENLEKANGNIPSWQHAYITMFSEYFYYRQEYGESLHNNWTTLTKHDFEQWIQKYFPSFKKCHPQSSRYHKQTLQTEYKDHMEKSRQLNINALQHILTIFDHDTDSPLRVALNESGIEMISDFITMLPLDIEALTYTFSVGNEDDTEPDFTSTIPLQVIYKGHIKILQGYIIHRINIGDPIKDNWTSITQKQLETYMVSNHWKVYQHDLNYGEPKATNDDTTLSCGQLIPASYHTDLDDTHMYFNSPCGELSRSVNFMSTSNNNLQQSETSATTPSNANKLSIPKPDILQPTIQPILPTTCQIIPVTHSPLPLYKSLSGAVTIYMKACCPKDIFQAYYNTSPEPEIQTKSEYWPSIEPEPPPYMIQGESSRERLCCPYRVYPSSPYVIALSYGEYTQFFNAHLHTIVIHSYKRKFGINHLHFQNSYRYKWGAIYTVRPLKDKISYGLRQYIYISAIWGVTENTQEFS